MLIFSILSFIMLFVITGIDFKKGIIPDWCLLLLFLSSAFWHQIDMLSAMVCLVIALTIFLLVKNKKTEDPIGYGDIKFISIAGFFIPLNSLPIFFMVTGAGGILLALLYRRKYFPFGPAIALGLAVTWIVSGGR